TTGALASYQGPLSTTMVQGMADRGFISATVQFANFNGPETCQDYANREIAIYDITRASSAVSVLCSLRGANCGAGIVTSGISEGAALAVIAKNYAPAVAAVYGMSISDFNQAGNVNLADCLDDPVTAITPERMVIVNGESDTIFGGQVPLMNLVGIQCPAETFQCWDPSLDGAGW